MASQPNSRLHVPLPVHDALRRGRPIEAIKALRDANPGLDLRAARDAVERLARNPASTLVENDPYGPTATSAPLDADTLPSEVAAKIATGNTRDAARRLRDVKPGLTEEEAHEAVKRRASSLLQEARTETIVRGDSGRYGWVLWVLALLIAAGGVAMWQLG